MSFLQGRLLVPRLVKLQPLVAPHSFNPHILHLLNNCGDSYAPLFQPIMSQVSEYHLWNSPPDNIMTPYMSLVVIFIVTHSKVWGFLAGLFGLFLFAFSGITSDRLSSLRRWSDQQHPVVACKSYSCVRSVSQALWPDSVSSNLHVLHLSGVNILFTVTICIPKDIQTEA